MSLRTGEVPTRLAAVDQDELQELGQKTAREREWYKNHPRFLTNAYIAVYASRGMLRRVRSDSNVVPTARFRNPNHQYTFPPFLLPASVLALAAVGRLWRQRLEESGIGRQDLRLAATSFARSEMYNAQLIADGALASQRSTHCVGAPFDIDASGYYTFTPDSGVQSVAHPDRQGSLELLAKQLGDRSSDNPYATRAANEPFDSRVTGALLLVAAELHADGIVNRIVEFSGTANQCVHICPNPEVTAEDWAAFGSAAVKPVWMG